MTSEFPPTPGTERPSYLGYWIGIALITVGYLLALLIWPPYFSADGAPPDPARTVLFFGRFHPLIVHMPIGILLLLLIVEVRCLSTAFHEKWKDMALFTAFLSACGMVMAVMAGIFLAREGGYKGGAYILHQAFGIVAAFGVIIAVFLRLGFMHGGKKGLLDGYRFFLLASFGLMSLGAHFGGDMVHGSKYLTEFAPDFIAKPTMAMSHWMTGFFDKKHEEPKADPAPATKPTPAPANSTASAPTPEPAPSNGSPAPTAPSPAPATPPAAGGDDKLVFQNVILPILESKCNKCHCEAKSKGDLRMDTYELAMKGGENDSNIVAGKPEESLAIKRILLPNDDDEHMPPDGKDQPTKEEVEVLKWWIKEGASDKLKVSEAKIPAELQATVNAQMK